MRRLGIALATTTLLLTACAGEEEPEEPTTGTETVEEDSTTDDDGALATEDAADGAEPTEDGADGAEATEDGDDGAEATEDAAEVTEDGAEATEDGSGGTDDDAATDDAAAADTTLDRPSEEILEEARLLVNGAVSLGPAAPEDEMVQLAICDYLFGTPEDVAPVVGAAPGSEVLLAPGSGYFNAGSNGGGPQCLWTVDGEEAFAAVVWSPEIDDEDEDGSLLASTPLEDSGYFGYVAVNPEWDGTLSLDEGGAIDWLEEAGTRWAGASI